MSADGLGGAGVEVGDESVRVSYRHANLHRTNESVLLRFEYDRTDGAYCVLFDAGEGVDTERLLGPNDTLAAVCLTHAHRDHYRALGDALPEGVPVYASPDTAAVLDDTLSVAEKRGVTGTERVREAVEPVEGWTDLAPGVRVHPVPAGHAPGAVGFVVRFEDRSGTHDALVTGDFTLSDVAGNPGLDTGLDVEAVFLTVAAAESASDALTDALADTVAGTDAGGPVLVTAGGLTGVHFATLLAAVAEELDRDVPVRLVGQAAKHYESLGFDHPNVETIPVFEEPEECLSGGVVTVAGPEEPTERSSGRLFKRVEQDPNATVVQLLSAGGDAVSRVGGDAFAHELSMHPTRTELNRVVDELDPAELVVVHRPGGAGKEFNDWSPCVWSPTMDRTFDLFDGGRWRKPPWMDGDVVRATGGPNRELGSFVDESFLDGTLADLPLASLERRDGVDLRAEGVDAERLRERLSMRESTGSGTESADDGEPTDAGSESTGDRTTADDHTDAADMSQNESDSTRPNRLFTTASASAEPDEDAVRAFRSQPEEPDDVFTARARERLAEKGGAAAEDGDGDGREAEAETADAEDADATPDTADEDHRTGDEAAETVNEEAKTNESGDECEQTADEREVDASETATEDATDGSEDAVEVTLDPLLVALVRRSVEAESVESFVVRAVESYLGSVLSAGDPPAGTVDALGIDVSVDSDLGAHLESAAAEASGVESVSDLVRTGLAAVLGGEGETTFVVDSLAPYESLLSAAAENESYGFETRDEVVEAAVLASL